MWLRAFLPCDKTHNVTVIYQNYLSQPLYTGTRKQLHLKVIHLRCKWVVWRRSNVFMCRLSGYRRSIWDLCHWAAMGVKIKYENIAYPYSENIAFIQLNPVHLNSRAYKAWICDFCSWFAFKYVHLSSWTSATDNKNCTQIAWNAIYGLFKKLLTDYRRLSLFF